MGCPSFGGVIGTGPPPSTHGAAAVEEQASTVVVFVVSFSVVAGGVALGGIWLPLTPETTRRGVCGTEERTALTIMLTSINELQVLNPLTSE